MEMQWEDGLLNDKIQARGEMVCKEEAIPPCCRKGPRSGRFRLSPATIVGRAMPKR